MAEDAGSDRPNLGVEKNVDLYTVPESSTTPQKNVDFYAVTESSPTSLRSCLSDRGVKISHETVSDDSPLPIDRYNSVDSLGGKDVKSECAVCGAALGKRKMKPRHHCRVCFQAVCAVCSPNWVKFDNEATVQRVCIPCGRNAHRAPALKARLEQVASTIHKVSAPSSPAFSFVDAVNEHQETGHGDDGGIDTLEDAVMACEFVTSNLQSLFESHVKTKTKITEVEEEAAQQRQACQRLEFVAKRVEDVENEAAQERQARIQLEAKARHAKGSCSSIADRIHALSGTHSSSRQLAVSLEDALADCDAAIVKLDGVISEERRTRKELEFEKNEALTKKERTIAVLQAELMKVRADAEQERKLRLAFQDSVLQSTSSSNGRRSASSVVLTDGDSSAALLLGPSVTPAQSITPAPTPPRMNSVLENATSDQPQSCCRRERCTAM